ncbi:MAG TPA: mismatch repair protein [Candidatus Angelobacter sp.]|nr:mismatch repair protein [Candidatus Angelobacter sp.]
MSQATSPAAVYSQRLQERNERLRFLQSRHVWIGNSRIVVLVAIVILWWRIGTKGSPSIGWLIAVIAGFIALIVVHRRVLRAIRAATRATALYQRGLARIEDRWSGGGASGEEFRRSEHVYADDLDIFGQGSLFQLLCGARTRMGKEKLAEWMLAGAELPMILQRQEAIRELRDKLDLREDLAVLGSSDSIEVDPAGLSAWASLPPVVDYRRWRIWAALLALLGTASIIARLLSPKMSPFLLLLLVNAILLFATYARWLKLFAPLSKASHNLDSLAEVLSRIENETFQAPLLRGLQARLVTGGLLPSACIARLRTLSNLEESLRNMFVQVLNIPLLYSIHLAFALEKWKDLYGRAVPAWLEVAGEIEALSSLGAYSFEHPGDPFCSFTPSVGEICFRGESLGHPLMPASQCVRNSISLEAGRQIWLVSGSNMSGKSTFLRIVGVNAVLGMMGAPVRASSLEMSPVSLGAAMRVSDSLQKGVSHFYAEISRIHSVVVLSQRGPLLFLFDEILQGTNSHDRRAGAEGIVKTLLQRGAIGLVTTHDLALTSISEVFPGKIRNVHFQEKLESGRLSFDYLLRDGIVTTSNGIELMKSVGLEV